MLSARETDVLLDKLCATLGFCLPPNAYDALKGSPRADINGFTDAVFVAEGFLDPSTVDRHLYRQVRSMVADAFRRGENERGYDSSDAGNR
jgi:hypothetical protein